MSRAASGSSVARHPWVKAYQNYFIQSSLPLTSLVFLAIPMIIYELGSRKVVAENHFQSFLSFFGANVRYLPAFGVASVLLVWHILRKDPWKSQINTCIGMVTESILLAFPILALGILVRQNSLLSLDKDIIISIGAGVYEEFAFRLFGLTLLYILLIDLFKMDKNRAMILMVVLSAVGFSLYHYLREDFAWNTFIFRSFAGVYFSVLFLIRGYGVTAGTHISYNIFCFSIRTLA